MTRVCPWCGSERAAPNTWREVDGVKVRYYKCLDCGGTAKSTQEITVESDLSPVTGPEAAEEGGQREIDRTT